MREFDLIQTYFAKQTEYRQDVLTGIGDDAAIVSIPSEHQLVITTDTLVDNIHFPSGTNPYDVGYKSLAVNLSDLAAMGAKPTWVTLALTLPAANENWVEGFCDGFFTLANRYQIQLVGGDLTEGPLTITVQALGLLKGKTSLLRSQAKVGDLIYVTGTLGDAGLALAALQKKHALPEQYEKVVLARLNRPEPRVETGQQLLDLAHSAIDISDGLAADLTHILKASGVGATIYVDKLPISEALTHSLNIDQAISLALTAGDDYELCFTVADNNRSALEAKLGQVACRFTCIGKITSEKKLTLCYTDGRSYQGLSEGYEHF